MGDSTSAAQDRAQATTVAKQLDAGDADSLGWAHRVLGIGKPLMPGLRLFASVGAAIAWAAVHLAWIAAVTLHRRRRRVRQRTDLPRRAR